MTSRVLSYLDTNACDSNLLIKEGNLIVTTKANALSGVGRTVHGSIAVADGISRYEAYHWSDQGTTFAGLLSIGVAQASGLIAASLDSATGLGFGYRPADGTIVSNGSTLATVSMTGERNCIGIYLFLSASVCTCTWLVNNTAVYTATLPNGKIWVPAISMGEDVRAGNRSATFNFGQDRFDFFDGLDGWFRQTAGLPTIYASLASEPFMSDSGDTPANQVYSPDQLNPKSMSFKCAPLGWFHRNDNTAVSSSYGSVIYKNEAGQYNALRDSDIRDATYICQKMAAPAFGSASILGAANQFVAIVDSVSAPTISTVQIALKGTLGRLDKPCPCRRVQPFWDEGAAGKIQPIGLGAQRNVLPLPLDEENLIYLLGDAPMSNVALVTDGGAPLDPLAVPAQWSQITAGGGVQAGAAIKLQSKSVYRISADVSSYGAQYTSGIVDILDSDGSGPTPSDGSFTTWSGGVPHGWALPTNPPLPAGVVANGSISQYTVGGISALQITSNVPYNTATTPNLLGYPVLLNSTPLLPGRTYRFSFRIVSGIGATVGGGMYGLQLLAGYTTDPRYAITPPGLFLSYAQSGTGGNNIYSWQYTVPASLTSNLGIYLCVSSVVGTVSVPTSNQAIIVIDDLQVELVGQFVSAPLTGMTMTQAFTEVLVKRAGEAAAIFSSVDTAAIDAATGILIGLRYEEQPNILQMLQDICDAFGAVCFEDENGIIRVRRMTDPRLGTPIAAFDTSCINGDDKSFIVSSDNAQGLTTSFGCRPNQTPFSGTGDFVTDLELVGIGQRDAWQRPCQINFESAVRPAQEYAHAVGAARRILPIDDPDKASAEANRVMRLFAPDTPGLPTPPGQIGTASSSAAGKGKFVQFEAFYDSALGIGPSVQPQQLYPCDVVTLTVPSKGFNATPLSVMSTEHFPADNRIVIVGRYQ